MQEQLIPAKLRQAKEKTNNDSKADERGENRHAFPKILSSTFSLLCFLLFLHDFPFDFHLTLTQTLAHQEMFPPVVQVTAKINGDQVMPVGFLNASKYF